MSAPNILLIVTDPRRRDCDRESDSHELRNLAGIPGRMNTPW